MYIVLELIFFFFSSVYNQIIRPLCRVFSMNESEKIFLFLVRFFFFNDQSIKFNQVIIMINR